MVASNQLSRRSRVEEKANYLFLIYYQIGLERSLEKLHEYCTSLRLKISLNSLKLYSIRFEWQRRLIEIEQEEKVKREARVTEQVFEMNERHAKIGAVFTQLAAAGLKEYVEKINQGKPLKLNVYELAALYTSGQRGERLAKGEATSREEVKVEIVNTFIQGFALIFMAVNKIDDEERRMQEYIRRCNDFIGEYDSEKKSKGLYLEGG